MSLPSKNRRALVAFLASAASLAFAAPVSAAPPLLETPADAKDCPTSDDLRRVIAAQLGRDDFDTPASPRVVVRIRRVESGSLTADVTVSTSTGASNTRTIEEGEACGDLVRAAALTVALAIEHDAAQTKEPKEKDPEPPPPPARPFVPEQPPQQERSVRNDRGVLTLSAVTTIGLVPRPSPGVGGAARLRLSDAVWLSGRGLWIPSGAMPNDEFALRFFALGPGLCAEPFGSGRVAAVGCAHAMIGAYDVARGGAVLDVGGVEPYFGASLFAGARARAFGPVHLEGGIDGQLPFSRPRYVTTTCPPVGFEPAFTALALWLGAGISL